MRDFPADWVEDHVFDVFRVTGLFGSKPKAHVGRRYDSVYRHILHVSKVPGMTIEQMVDGLKSLTERGYLRLAPEESGFYLTQSGFQKLSEPGFHKRTRLAAPPEALKAPKDDQSMKAASVFAVAFATLTGQS